MRQHQHAIEMRTRVLNAKSSSDEHGLRKMLTDLRRNELRELTPQQRDEQARYIAQQCDHGASPGLR